MLFAETREHLFPCLLVKRKGDCRVFLHKPCKTCGNLFFLTLFRHLNSHRKARLREIDSGELEYVFRVTERVARFNACHFCDNAYIACDDCGGVLLLCAFYKYDFTHFLDFARAEIVCRGVGRELAGNNLEERHLAYKRVCYRLEADGCERTVFVAG